MDKEYKYTNKNFLNHLHEPAGGIKRRQFHRIRCDVNISIKDISSSLETYAQCTDISLGGIGIKILSYAKLKLFPQDKLEIWIHLKDGLKPIHRWGKLMWFKQVDASLYRGGIRFLSSQYMPLIHAASYG